MVLRTYLVYNTDRYYDRKKKVLVICLAGALSLLWPEKKVLVIYLAGARSLLRPEKKVLVICLAGAQLLLFYDWLTTYEFVCENSYVSIRSINDGALFGGRREETHENANKIQICMIDWPHMNLYVVTHMF